MNWITVAWPIIAGACLTLAVMHLLVWARDRRAGVSLAFASLAICVACIAAFELAMTRVQTAQQFGTLRNWMLLPVFAAFVSVLVFVRLHFQAGRLWLAHATWIVRLAGLVFNSFSPPHLFYREITGLRQTDFLGATISVAEGPPSPWLWFNQLSVLLLVAFVADAARTMWRRGGAVERRRAMVVGGSLMVFLLVAGTLMALVSWQVVDAPYLVSPIFLVMVGAMGYELSRDVLRAAQLTGELRESQQRIDLAARAASLGFWTWDVGRDEIWANEAARSLLGFSPTERLGSSRLSGVLHPDDRDGVTQAIEAALAHGGEYERQYRIRLSSGEIRWIAARGRAEPATSGQPLLMRGVVMDVTAERRAELELQRLRGQLTHVGRVSMLGQLSSALAHELTQPLGAILRNAEAAEIFLRADQPDLEELRAIIADIRKDDQRAGDVIDRLRSMLKRRVLEPHPIAVGELLDEATTLARADAAARGVTLEISAAPDLPPILGDRVHLQQVLLNLVLNAMDAMAENGHDGRCVRLAARRDGESKVAVSVSDAGHGIAPEQLPHIFEPFFTTKPHGIGIGLAISHTIIAAHGGQLTAENNPDGRGATFRLALPVAAHGVPA
jgi:PAS domain S-box-containing protein